MKVCPRCCRLFSPTEERCSFDGAFLQVPADPRVGETIDKYRLMGVLGKGGMGSVYRAEHILIGKDVAVKILNKELHKNENLVERFLLEARAASMIRHPNIIDMMDFGFTPDGCSYCVMEYLEGPTLATLMDEVGAIPLYRTVNIMVQVCRGLGAGHEVGIVHRDMKPENIALMQMDGRRHIVTLPDALTGEWRVEKEKQYDLVKILDFGVAAVGKATEELDKKTRQEGIVFGSPEYIAPEQILGENTTSRTDVYSIGVIFYEMLTGDVPFFGTSAQEIMRHHLHTPPTPPRQVRPDLDLPKEVDILAMSALSKNPDKRPAGMEEFIGSLRRCLGKTFYKRDLKQAVHKYRETLRHIPAVDSQKPPKAPETSQRKEIHEEIGRFFKESKEEPSKLSPSEINRCVKSQTKESDDPEDELKELRLLLRKD